jgi:hypothetical protein
MTVDPYIPAIPTDGQRIGSPGIAKRKISIQIDPKSSVENFI